MSVLAPEPVQAETGDSGITHMVCCDEDIAICGTDVSGQPFVGDDEPVDCVVCLDLRICPVCGDPIVVS